MDLLYSTVFVVFDKVRHLMPIPASFSGHSDQDEEHEKPSNFHEALRQTLKEKDYKGTIKETHPMSDEFQRRDSKLDSAEEPVVKKTDNVSTFRYS
jgi:hypothetical protein